MGDEHQWGGPQNRLYNNTLVGTKYSLVGAGPYGGSAFKNNIFTTPDSTWPQARYQSSPTTFSLGPIPSSLTRSTMTISYNPAHQPSVPALVIPPYTNGFSGSAPDIGAYDHTKPPWKAGVQAAANVSAPTWAPFLTPGTVAVVTGSVPFDAGASVLITDGANNDLAAALVYVVRIAGATGLPGPPL